MSDLHYIHTLPEQQNYLNAHSYVVRRHGDSIYVPRYGTQNENVFCRPSGPLRKKVEKKEQ